MPFSRKWLLLEISTKVHFLCKKYPAGNIYLVKSYIQGDTKRFQQLLYSPLVFSNLLLLLKTLTPFHCLNRSPFVKMAQHIYDPLKHNLNKNHLNSLMHVQGNKARKTSRRNIGISLTH